MAVAIWPISAMAFPIDQSIAVDTIVNSFGDGYEQRINTSVPRSRANNQGGVTTHVGVKSFKVRVSRLQWLTNPVSGNSNLDNSGKKLWEFYLARFYNSTTNKPQYESFYWYNPIENDQTDTWTGDSSSSGSNSRSEAVTNTTGRYLVKFPPSLSFTQVKYCIFDIGLDLQEVVA